MDVPHATQTYSKFNSNSFPQTLFLFSYFPVWLLAISFTVLDSWLHLQFTNSNSFNPNTHFWVEPYFYFSEKMTETYRQNNLGSSRRILLALDSIFSTSIFPFGPKFCQFLSITKCIILCSVFMMPFHTDSLIKEICTVYVIYVRHSCRCPGYIRE